MKILLTSNFQGKQFNLQICIFGARNDKHVSKQHKIAPAANVTRWQLNLNVWPTGLYKLDNILAYNLSPSESKIHWLGTQSLNQSDAKIFSLH